MLVNPLTGEVYLDAEGNELKFVGKQKMIDYIKEHDDFRAEYEKAVSTYINHSKRDISLIDEEDLKTILEAEKSVENAQENAYDDNYDSSTNKTDTEEPTT